MRSLSVPHRVGKAARGAGSRVAWAWRTARHRTALADRPRVFCNSFQKSGTHLLVGLVTGVSPFRAYGRKTYWHALNRSRVDLERRRTPSDVVRELARALPGEVLRGHLEHDPRIADVLDRPEWRHLLILRDPRDALVSLLHWWKRHREIDAWPVRLFRRLSSDEERLRFLVEGWESDLVPADWPRDVDFPNVASRCRAYRGWIEDERCLVVRFEDLVDEGAGPDARRRIVEFLRPDLRGADVDSILARMERTADPSRSKTFRRGEVGEWAGHATGRVAERFDEVAGPVLAEWGYR